MSSGPETDQAELATYTNPMGIQISLDYPVEWYGQSVSQTVDPKPEAGVGAKQVGVVVSNTAEAMPAPNVATPSPGPLPENPSLPMDYVTVTVLAVEGQMGDAAADLSLPLSMDDAQVVPGVLNMRILEATVAGTRLTIALSAGPQATSSDIALAESRRYVDSTDREPRLIRTYGALPQKGRSCPSMAAGLARSVRCRVVSSGQLLSGSPCRPIGKPCHTRWLEGSLLLGSLEQSPSPGGSWSSIGARTPVKS